MAFHDEQRNGIPCVSSDFIRFPHAFTTRYGGVSTGYLESLNLVRGHGDSAENLAVNYSRAASLVGAEGNACAVTNQVHGATVRIVDEKDRHIPGTDVSYEADGIVTATPYLPLFCFTADCAPLLLCDPENGVVGAIHCGWRSTALDIVKNGLDAMISLGTDPKAVWAAIGPALGFCCFESDEDVPDALEKLLHGDSEALFRKREDGKTMVDLRGTIKRRLVQLGVPETQIDVSKECTFCSHEKFWSHRYTKGKRGGQAAIIVYPGGYK